MTSVGRLAGRTRLEAVRALGGSGRGHVVRARVLRNDGEGARAGIAIRASVSAVERNRARRRVRAALREVLSGRPGVDVLITAAAGDVTRAPFAWLCEDVADAVGKAASRAAAVAS